ncbi:superoxide dismutase family protein, partial [Parageobacillus sp. SY1]
MFQKLGLLLAVFLFAAGCKKENVTNLEVNMINSAGDSIGTIKLSEQAKGVKLKLDLEGLPPGEHAIHI